MKNNPLFKTTLHGSINVLPPSFDELVSAEHPVRVVSKMLDKVDLSMLLTKYSGGGAPSYHPRMMLKLIVYAYLNKVYSSREIQRHAEESLPYMWIAGGYKPSYRTICRFCAEILTDEYMSQIFEQVVKQLVDYKVTDFRIMYVDGTTIQARSSKNSIVWGSNIERYKAAIVENANRQILEARKIAKSELEEMDKTGELIEENANAVKAALKNLEEKDNFKNKPSSKEERDEDENEDNDNHNNNNSSSTYYKKERDARREKKAKERKKEQDELTTQLTEATEPLEMLMKSGKYSRKSEVSKQLTILKSIARNDLPRLNNYNLILDELNGRKGMSKHEPSASAMKMKDTPYDSHQSVPGYNIQLATNNSYIHNYAVSQCAADQVAFSDLFKNLKNYSSKLPETIVADAGFGTQENYFLCDKEGISTYIKYPEFDRQENGSIKGVAGNIESFTYDKEQDTYLCPEGKILKKVDESKTYLESGFVKTTHIYKPTTPCTGCPIIEKCIRNRKDRPPLTRKVLTVNHERNERVNEEREKLRSPEGLAHRRQRGHDVETANANIKGGNMKYTRSARFGIEKVSIEVGLICLGNNLRKFVKSGIGKLINHAPSPTNNVQFQDEILELATT